MATTRNKQLKLLFVSELTLLQYGRLYSKFKRS